MQSIFLKTLVSGRPEVPTRIIKMAPRKDMSLFDNALALAMEATPINRAVLILSRISDCKLAVRQLQLAGVETLSYFAKGNMLPREKSRFTVLVTRFGMADEVCNAFWDVGATKKDPESPDPE